jgi:hypothetical protein
MAGKKYTVLSAVRVSGELHKPGAELTLEDKETSGIEHCIEPAGKKAASKPADDDKGDDKGEANGEAKGAAPAA